MLFCESLTDSGNACSQIQQRGLQEGLQQKLKELHNARDRLRRLRLQRQTLMQQLKGHDAALGLDSAVQSAKRRQQAVIHPYDLSEPLRDSPKEAPAAARATVSLSRYQQLVQLQRYRRSSSGEHRTRDPQAAALGPISAFKHHAPISFSSITKDMAVGKLLDACSFHILPQAISEYQHRVAHSVCAPESEICWFLECLHSGMSPPLSLSTSVSSPECRLSASLSQITTSLESLFLILEHEEVSLASSASFNPPVHPCLDPSLPHPLRPNKPDAAVASEAFVRCGVNQRRAVVDAVNELMKPLLEKYRMLLPRDKWRAACMQGMRVAQLIIDMLRAAPGPAQNDSDESHRPFTVESNPKVSFPC